MTGDLVERLREAIQIRALSSVALEKDNLETVGRIATPLCDEIRRLRLLASEAADEIERLRASPPVNELIVHKAYINGWLDAYDGDECGQVQLNMAEQMWDDARHTLLYELAHAREVSDRLKGEG